MKVVIRVNVGYDFCRHRRHRVPVAYKLRWLHANIPKLGLLADVSPSYIEHGLGGKQSCCDLLLNLPAEAAANEKGAEDDGT